MIFMSRCLLSEINVNSVLPRQAFHAEGRGNLSVENIKRNVLPKIVSQSKSLYMNSVGRIISVHSNSMYCCYLRQSPIFKWREWKSIDIMYRWICKNSRDIIPPLNTENFFWQNFLLLDIFFSCHLLVAPVPSPSPALAAVLYW